MLSGPKVLAPKARIAPRERYRAPDTEGRGLRTRGSRQSVFPSLVDLGLSNPSCLSPSATFTQSVSLLSFNCISSMGLIGELVSSKVLIHSQNRRLYSAVFFFKFLFFFK